MDSCYNCEMGTEGLTVPHPVFKARYMLICWECALKAIYSLPRLAAFSEITGVKS